MCFLLKKGISLKVNYFILCPVCQQEMARCPADSPVFTVSRGKISPGWALLPPAPQQKSPAAFHAQGSRARYFAVKSASASPRGRGRPPRRPPGRPAPSARPAAAPPTAGRGQLPSSPKARSTWREQHVGQVHAEGGLGKEPGRGAQPGASPLDRGQQGENPRRHQADTHAHALPELGVQGAVPEGGEHRPPKDAGKAQPKERAPHRRRRGYFFK